MESTNKDIIYQGNSIISIETLPDYSQPVVVKKPARRQPSQRSLRSLENEYEMTRALDGVEGVRKALGQQSIENQPALILEYIDGETLRDDIARGTRSLRSRLEIAVGVARILAEIHQQGVIHLDLNSKNILIGKEPGAVHIIDLGAAARIDRSGQQKVGPDQMLGTLPYISPEQTGRINRAVDERSDLYSLGVVLYELVTGHLPFDSKDPLELVHNHIARVPVSPSEVSSGIPEVLSAIIKKLLSKNAEDRYQSAAGVQADLEKCFQRLSPEDTIEGFPLGEADYASRLRFPQELYGRGGELRELESAFESVCRDTSSIVFVGGYSGIGKTALVEEIQRPVSEKSGYFIQGKFDQLATTPYAGITQALARFVSQILTQTETQLAAWRARILGAVGPNGRVLTDVVPSLELVIGPQLAVPDLSGQEAQNRFNYVFQRFFGAIARSEHPICFFLDDLQWVDPGSLGLLRNLFSSPDLAHLLVVGTYRDNEVHEDHPLMALIAGLERAGANLRRMTLQKLSEADVDALISDLLRRDPGEIQELSRLVYSQTEGNPFFTRQVLRSMEDEGLLALDTATGRWHWDMDDLRDMDVMDSVVELLVSKLKELPAGIQETLKVAACIGNPFDIATLAVITAGDDDAILDHVQETVAAGLIWERNDRGHFVHDGVQEAAYALVSMEERDRFHLTIGRLLLQRHRASDDEQDPYRIVDQLNHGLRLIEDEQERFQTARLNLHAAQAAHQASAFETGLNYAKAGIELLGENCWNQDYRLTLDLHEQAALLAYAAGDIPGMKQHSEQVLQFGRDPLDLARVQRLHTEFLISLNRFDEAVVFGLEALRILGQEFPPKPEWALTIKQFSEFLERLEQEPPDYFSMPRLYDQDPELLAVSEILLPVGFAAFISRPALAPLIDIRSLELSLERQLLPEHTPWKIASVGVIANSLLGKIELAYRYGETAIELASRAAFPIYAPLHIHALYNHFRRKPLREALDLYDRALQSAHDCGNNEFVANTTQAWSNHAFYASIELAQVEERSLKLRTFLDAIQYVTRSRWVNIQVTAAQALRGSSSARGTTWQGTPFDDDRDLPELQRVEDKFGLLFAYCAKAWVATLFGDHDGVEEYSDLSYSFLVAGLSGLEKATLAFIGGLRRARELRETPDRPESEQALEEQLGLLERFAGLAPMNFAHKLSLVQAEVHRARGEVVQAMQSYEKASQGARENDYLNEAGLAHALAAEFYQDLGLSQPALHNAEQAAQAWRSWGAHALVESLSQRFPDLLGPPDSTREVSLDAHRVQTTITQSMTPLQLDLESIISASQLLAAETDLEQLLDKMMALVMNNSGAENAVLLLRQGVNWFVQARSTVGTLEHDIILNTPYDPANIDNEGITIPEPVFNYCRRSKEVLVVGDARVDQRFAGDRTIQEHKIQSIACIPALSQGQLKALLYLENRQMADVFTLERVELLKHLAAQFAVSVENALLYDSLNEKVRELQESEEELARHRDHLEAAVAERTYELDERVKELDCLYGISRLAGQQGFSLEQILGGAVDLLPPSWKYPEIACARIVLNEQEFKTDNFRATPWQQSAAIVVRGERAGQVEVAYLEERSDAGEGPFLDDQRLFLEAVAERLGTISERKQAEKALQASEEQYRDLVEKITDVIYSVDSEGVITFVNPAVESLLGLPPEQVMGQPFAHFIHPDDLGQVQDNVQSLFSSLAPGPTEYRVLNASDETRWIRVASQPVVDGGQVTGLQGVLTDITERKAVEEQLEEATIAAERQRLARELHDSVTQSLHAANLIAETLPSKWEEDPEEGRRGLALLQRFAQGALAEMRTLLLELHPAALEDQELPVLLRQLADAMMARSRAVVTTTVTGECTVPNGVKVTLYRIAQEALNNVVKHAGARLVRVNLQCSGARGGAQTILSIKDDGCGFDPESTQPAGLGIGIMRDRAGEIDASLSITSQPDQGTEVLVEWQDMEMVP